MNLTPAHIRNHYFSREDMSHLRVPRSDVANNQVLGDYIFDLSEPPRWETLSAHSPSNSPSPSPAPEEPPPPCAATEFFDYHDDLPSFTAHGGHRDPPPDHASDQGTEAPTTPPFIPPRPWTPADDHLLRSYKEDAKKRPSWKSLASLLRRSQDDCKIRWNLIRTSPTDKPPDALVQPPLEEPPMDDSHDPQEPKPKRRKS